MKRISAFLICVLLLVCCFAGCGNNEDTTTTTGIDPISSITPIPLSSTYDGPVGIFVVEVYDSIRNGAEITSVCPVDLSKF